MEIPLVLHTHDNDMHTRAVTSECISEASEILRYLCGQRSLTPVNTSNVAKKDNDIKGKKDNIASRHPFNTLEDEIDFFVRQMDPKLASLESRVSLTSSECDKCRQLIKTHLSKGSPTLACRSGDVSRARIEIESLALMMERVATKHQHNRPLDNTKGNARDSNNNGNAEDKARPSSGSSQSIHQSFLNRNKDRSLNEKPKAFTAARGSGQPYMSSWQLHAADMQARMNQIEQESLKSTNQTLGSEDRGGGGSVRGGDSGSAVHSRATQKVDRVEKDDISSMLDALSSGLMHVDTPSSGEGALEGDDIPPVSSDLTFDGSGGVMVEGGGSLTDFFTQLESDFNTKKEKLLLETGQDQSSQFENAEEVGRVASAAAPLIVAYEEDEDDDELAVV